MEKLNLRFILSRSWFSKVSAASRALFGLKMRPAMLNRKLKLQKQAEVCWVWQTTWEPQETSWESWCHLLSRPGMNQAAWWRLVFCGNFSGCGRSLPHQMSQIQHLLKWKDPPTAAWCSPTLKHREGDTSISTVTFLLDKFNYIYDIFPNSEGINHI